ncbi:putative immunity protein [Nocardiopsis sp. NPDC101807]|uniref:putative immunity protein n=1 Tax=Nocardiopsis sp. NPDC101807 TaxID=3364339 RepID=UPI0037F1405A
MADASTAIELDRAELREVTGFAVACARPSLALFESERPGDRRPRAAIEAALAFADGAERTKAIRDNAWAAHRAAQETRDAGRGAASAAARAAANTCGAAFLHPLAEATQVKHILASAAYTAHALELSSGDGPDAADDHLARLGRLATPVVVDVLGRYPDAPPGGGRVGELVRRLDASLRRPPPAR